MTFKNYCMFSFSLVGHDIISMSYSTITSFRIKNDRSSPLHWLYSVFLCDCNLIFIHAINKQTKGTKPICHYLDNRAEMFKKCYCITVLWVREQNLQGPLYPIQLPVCEVHEFESNVLLWDRPKFYLISIIFKLYYASLFLIMGTYWYCHYSSTSKIKCIVYDWIL